MNVILSSLVGFQVDWTSELHKKFVQAVEQLGVDQAIPSKILEVMKVEGLTRHNVASHLQVSGILCLKLQQYLLFWFKLSWQKVIELFAKEIEEKLSKWSDFLFCIEMQKNILSS